MPRSLTVVGAGVIGIEYATIFSALDVPVTIIEPRENFLEFIDREIVDEFIHDLRDRGMQFGWGSRSSGSSSTSRACREHPVGRPPGPHRDAALRRRPHRRDRGTSGSRTAASRPTTAGG